MLLLLFSLFSLLLANNRCNISNAINKYGYGFVGISYFAYNNNYVTFIGNYFVAFTIRLLYFLDKLNPDIFIY